jgi:hypothetical protein
VRVYGEASLSNADVIANTVILHLNSLHPEKHGGGIYTDDIDYLISTTKWDSGGRKKHAYEIIQRYIPLESSVVEVGSASGISGCHLLASGYTDLTFCDFEGVGLRFIQYVLPLVGLSGKVVPYGQEGVYDWVIALDVIEHVPNPLTFLRWVYGICRVGVVLTYPETVGWQPPYAELRIDEHVDTKLLCVAASVLFNIEHSDYCDGGRTLVLRRAL